MGLPPALITKLRRWRRRAHEFAGSARYSRPALNALDVKLEQYLDLDGGFFVEAGANDGFTQSNTYYFERLRGWRGLLIEPLPELCALCRLERPSAKVIQAALVGPDFVGSEIEVQFAGLMSVTDEALEDAEARQKHVETGLRVQGLVRTYAVRVPARTLGGILADEVGAREVDLLSLDVEGAELAALSGLDLSRHAPRYICVEVRRAGAVTSLLHPLYECVAVLHDSGSHQDLLYRRR